MKQVKFEIKDFIFLTIILIIALIFRIYKINSPLADLHSWRQADTAAVARNFVTNGFDLLHPRYDDLSGRESGLENPKGYRMVEFPIYNAIFAGTYKFLPILPIEVYGRLTTVFFSLVIISIIYILVLKEASRLAAISASLIYSVFPFFVFFSRVVLPETTALAMSFLSILFLYLFSQKKESTLKEYIFLLFSIIFFSLGLLVKPTVVFYVLPLIYLFIKKYNLKFMSKFSFYIYFIIAFVLFFLWRLYIRNYPEGIPASDWLITSVNTYQGLQNIFFRPAFFRWIFFERLNNMIFGGYLAVLFVLGILKRNHKYFFHSLLFSAFVYLFIFEGGNIQHEYYQTIILPTLAIFIGLGVETIFNFDKKNFHSNFFRVPIILAIFALSFFFSYYRIKDFYSTPSDLTSIAKIIKTITLPEDKIITDRLGDTTLLYLADRKGWPAYTGNLAKFKTNGYKYIVTANKDLINELKTNKTYKLTYENDKFTIFKL